MHKKHEYIDLFSGAGGFSEGFIRQGFSPIAHVEFDRAACFTLKTRIAYHYLSAEGKEDLYYSYIKGDISRKQLYAHIPKELLESVINEEIGKGNKKIFKTVDSLLKDKSVDLIIGGPPCQAYSRIGIPALKHKDEDDRTKLYIHYGRFLQKYNPKIFVFENVPGILSAADGQYFRNLKKYYKRLGYNVDAKLLNARNFNVIQNRARVIIIGWQKKLDLRYPEFEKTVSNNTRNDIFYDLPAIFPGDNDRLHYYAAEVNDYLKNTAIRKNGVPFVSQHITRPHNKRDLNIYRMAINKLNKGGRLKNDQIPQTMRTQQNITDFLDRFKVVDTIPHTMLAHIAKDGHHFIHPDIKQLRSISVREAARIQSFPDDYYFEGIKEAQSKTAAFRQIGNAVPPLMAQGIANKIMDMLSDCSA